MFNTHIIQVKSCLGVMLVLCFWGYPMIGRSVRQQHLQNGAIPLFNALLNRQVTLKPELNDVHPRLFFTSANLPRWRESARGSGKELWLATLGAIKSLKRDVPDPQDEELYKSGLAQKKGSISQYALAFEIAQTSFAFTIEKDEKYLAAAKKWTFAACAMPFWGYRYNKPNVDLPPAHLLYAVAFAYDTLYDKFSAQEKSVIRNKLLVQGRLMYDHFKYKPGKRYTYTQNHTWIPMAGLAIAAYAIMDEVDEAKAWATLARAVFDRTMLASGTDGYFYESFHYYGFAFRWAIRYFDAHLSATGENLYRAMQPKLNGMKYFAMHSVLPDGENVFDFADIGDGALNRNGTGKRENLYAEYDIMYRLAAVYRDPKAQAVGDYLRTQTKLGTREPMWAFISRDHSINAAPLEEIPPYHYFKDNDTVFWRTGWTKDATAFAFRCAPPEGHHSARLASKIPDWRQNTGHAHPDANSFIIWANGKYLTGDTGYLGIKETDAHNTILVNGRGQEKDGVYEMFKDVPNERLDKIRLAEVDATAKYFYARGEAASGYYGDLGLRKFDRHFLFVPQRFFVVWDELETEKASKFTFLLNADREISLSDFHADLINDDSALRVFRIEPVTVRSEVVDQIVQARGLPGSVDKGDLEKRGLQLRATSDGKDRNASFVHVLFPFKRTDRDRLPTVSSAQPGLGVAVRFANGDQTVVCFAGSCADVKVTEGRVTVRSMSKGKVSKDLVWQK